MEKYTREWFVEQGRKGGKAYTEKNGIEAVRANFNKVREKRWKKSVDKQDPLL